MRRGSCPADFPQDEPLRPNELRRAGEYIVYDVPVSDGIVLRGCYFTKTITESRRGIVAAAAIAAPLLLAAAALGGWFITSRSFAPIDKISKTAKNIENGSDLTARLGLPDKGDEVSRLGAAFDGMLDRLEGAFAAEKQFSSDVSHELRTPIAVIRSECEYVLSGVDETTVKSSLREIQSKACDMSALVSRLLELSRAENSAASVKLQPTDLSELLHVVAEELSEKAAQKNISVTVETEKAVTVRGEQTLLLRLLLNLTENAIKYTPAGGSVLLKAQRAESGIRLSVSDTGIGISKADAQNIFRRFYRADSSRTRAGVQTEGGYGLGLALCKWIADVHFAAISVESELGRGSEFIVLFPA